jgi:hypothetical protein
MRRRQAYATDQYEQAAELVKEPETKKVEKPVKKGYCRKCGVRVGRGVYGHQQKCNGTP